MNLIINVNSELHSIKNSAEGELKKQSAVAQAMEEIKSQAIKNQERIKKGLNPLPYSTVVKDEYGKELVVIKETKSLGEIRKEYRKKQNSYSFANKERNLLLAMNEIGNSKKNEYEFKDELNKQLNSSLFVINAELTPTQEKILDYFGDFDGLFNSINFKEDISAKCIKDLIDLPSPKTGKPPKEFEELLSNIMSINKIFKQNPNRKNYIETARTYINIRYQKIVPEKFKVYFKERGGLFTLIENLEKNEAKQQKINSLEFEISEKNFKKVYQSFCTLEEFRNKPLKLASYLFKRVPEENKQNFAKWFNSMNFDNSTILIKTLSKWTSEVEDSKTKSVKKKDIEPKNLRGE
ncbi:hypothetical protein [Treponema pectinovorum]|uniref:hypothetical protein n=1 Tax=Treponema pectinovorum TaxID=164 RepID=UPI0011F205BD|nr:hypothetical protein [Treponema pectinovorum]